MMEQRGTNNNVMDFALESKKLALRKRMRLLRRILIPVILALAVLAYITGVVSFGITFAQDLADSARIALLPEVGYPVQSSITELYAAQELKGGLVALGPESCEVYSAKGNRLRNIQTGYGRPGISVGKNRFVLYNRSGTELRVENRARTLYTRNMENGILSCELSPGGTLAVATTHSRYTAELTVFSPAMGLRMQWDMAESQGTPICMGFAADNNRLAVVSLRASGGDTLAGLYLMDVRKGTTTLLAEEPGAVPLKVLWQGSGRILVLYDTAAVAYQASTGAVQARYAYAGPLLGWSMAGQSLALLTRSGDGAEVTLLDKALEKTAAFSSSAQKLALTHTAVYLWDGEEVECRSMAGEYQWRSRCEQKPLAVLDAKQLLLLCSGVIRPLEELAQNG